MKLSRISVSARLALLAAVNVVALAGIAALGGWGIAATVRHSGEAMRTVANDSAAMVTVKAAQASFLSQVQEWKDILIRGNDAESFAKYRKAFDEKEATTQQQLAEARRLMPADSPAAADIARVSANHAELGRKYREALTHFDPADAEAGKQVDRLVKGIDRSTTDGLNALVTTMEKNSVAGLAAQQQAIDADGERSTQIFVGVALLTLLTVATLALLIRRDLLRELGGEPAAAADAVRRVAAGDLSVGVMLREGDETSLMAALKTMQDNLTQIVAEIRELAAEAADGHFDRRIDTAARQGFAQDIGMALNTLLQTTDAGLGDVQRVSQALAAGDLSATIEKRYPGQFGHTARAINATVAALNAVVADVRTMVDAAAQGDFERNIDVSVHRGYARTLAELLNQLNATASTALHDIAEVGQALAAGDLRQKIERPFPGLFGATAAGINTTIERLREMIAQIQSASVAIETAAGEISSGNGDLSRRTEAQASSLEETASTIEQITATVSQNARNAQQAQDLAQSSNEVATRGGRMVKDVVQTMTGIRDSSQRVADIVGVIDGIAFQTNILALNAAVEAARAGEQGRGFAVVASEVRNLAQRSAAAAKEIRQLIADSVDQVEGGVQAVETAGRTMDEVVASFARVAGLVAEIAAASREQASGVQQVNLAIGHIDETTQQNAALVEEAAAAAESLAEQSRELVTVAATFKLSGEGAALPRLEAPGAKVAPVLPAVRLDGLRVARGGATGGDAWEEF